MADQTRNDANEANQPDLDRDQNDQDRIGRIGSDQPDTANEWPGRRDAGLPEDDQDIDPVTAEDDEMLDDDIEGEPLDR